VIDVKYKRFLKEAENMSRRLKGAIFDMDGVIVDTVPVHFKAWKRMFNEFGKEFDMEDYKNKVDGIPRTDGARAILTDISDGELQKATDKKQEYFLEYLGKEDIPVFESTIELIKDLKARGVKIAVISSSKNSPYILEKTGVIKLIDTNIGGNDITKGKPDPQIFLMAAKKIDVSPESCVVFEDALLGVEAAKRANMICVGVNRHNDPVRLHYADIIITDLKEIDFDKLESLLRR
jgi:beta-phosphoglucomutase